LQTTVITVAQQQQTIATQVAIRAVLILAILHATIAAITAVTNHAALIHAQPVYVTPAVKVAVTALAC